MSQCDGPDCTHHSHNEGLPRASSKPHDLDSHRMAQLIAQERANQRPLTVAEAEELRILDPKDRAKYLEKRRERYAVAARTAPRDCFTGEFTVNTQTAGAVINVAVSALRKIGYGSGLGAKLEARQALMQMQRICEENQKMIPRAPENKSIESPDPKKYPDPEEPKPFGEKELAQPDADASSPSIPPDAQ